MTVEPVAVSAPQEPEPAPALDPTPTTVPAVSPVVPPTESRTRAKHERMSEVRPSIARTRAVAARVIRGIATVAGCCLIAAAVLIAVKANPDNSLVSLVRHLARFFDLGFFSLSNPIKKFTGPHGPALTALLNYGIGAVVWFVLGGFVARLVGGKSASR